MPRTPASETRTFEPPPRTLSGRPASLAIATISRRASPPWTSTSQSAAPPTLNVVNGASGASQRTWPLPNASMRRALRSPTRISAKLALAFPERIERLLPRALLKFNPVAWSELTRDRQVGRDNGRDPWVTAGRLPIRHQQDRSSRCWYLNRSKRRRVREGVSLITGTPQERPIEPISHAVRLRRNDKARCAQCLDCLHRK